MQGVSGERSRDQHLWGEEAGLGRGRGAVPTEAFANHTGVLQWRWPSELSQVEVRELDLSVLSAGCRLPSGKGRGWGRTVLFSQGHSLDRADISPFPISVLWNTLSSADTQEGEGSGIKL